jgi:hypothetical protein
MSTDRTHRPLCPMHRLDVPKSRPPRPGTLATGTPVETIEWREGQLTRGPRRLPVSW